MKYNTFGYSTGVSKKGFVGIKMIFWVGVVTIGLWCLALWLKKIAKVKKRNASDFPV